MDEVEIYLKKQDLLKMLEVIDKFPEYDDKNFKVKYRSCELGSTLNMIIATKFDGIDWEASIPIVDVDQW